MDILSVINESKRRKVIGVLLIAIVALGLSVNFLERDISELDGDELNVEQREVLSNPEGGYPSFEYSYSAGNESLTLEAERPLIAHTGGLRIGNGSENFLLNSSGAEARTDTWASTSLFDSLKFESISLARGLSNIGSSSLTDFPISTGEKLTIKKDFTDSDGDGTKGIENNETITLFTEQMDGSIEKFAYVSISNNTVRVYRLDSYSDNEWKPCDLDREDLCETVRAYDFR